ncbi:MAG: ATP-binding protein [Oscillospiraceae bacterium]|nr:ATP-binding protein [Oscillospiraceae bacterium]
MDLFVFDSIENDSCVKGILEKNDTAVLRNIIRFAETEGVTTNSIREYTAAYLANDDNILSSLAQSGKKIGDDLKKLALLDLEQIYKKLFSISIKYSPSGNDTGFSEGYIHSIKEMTAAKSAEELLELLINHYRSFGSGILGKYIAYRYDGKLEGIANTDKTTFDSLVGLEHQKKVLIENTEAFVNGKPANNVLLFGDRGTGKSSSVKALLNMFAERGLRVVEMPKGCIKSIPSLTEKLSLKPNKYIIFLDDLSFESRDAEYKALKTAMEGQLQPQPDNVLIYATSNRRHLIKETYEDRQGGEMHVNDNMQETLSLAERFGISLVFSAPNQKEYLHIVEELLKANGIEMTPELEKKAIVWQMNYGGKSARCAKQFVASCAAKKVNK